MRKWARERERERLRVALHWFRRQHSEKMVCMRGVPVVAGTIEKANSHFDPTQDGSGTALLR